ncbi:hypothetical protein NUW54_g9134 [Trametes sanguinea]|uniref:Uncharacterized protein n=1 Tax=Trametes sanguinea TaxID=158606 RepID=A0ACC1P9Z9_9APHY|nr:hypothetical protein NUW54_g9134 [Trametes sanguinea]
MDSGRVAVLALVAQESEDIRPLRPCLLFGTVTLAPRIPSVFGEPLAVPSSATCLPLTLSISSSTGRIVSMVLRSSCVKHTDLRMILARLWLRRSRSGEQSQLKVLIPFFENSLCGLYRRLDAKHDHLGTRPNM